MKSIKIIISIRCSDSFYEKNITELKNSILSGSFQRDMENTKFNDEQVKVKVTYEQTNIKNRNK